MRDCSGAVNGRRHSYIQAELAPALRVGLTGSRSHTVEQSNLLTVRPCDGRLCDYFLSVKLTVTVIITGTGWPFSSVGV